MNEWENKKGGEIFNSAVKGVWEGGAWSTRTGDAVPRTVLMVNANALPEDLNFEPGVRSKVSMISSPIQRLKHGMKLSITKQMVAAAKINHLQLPSILGLGIQTLSIAIILRQTYFSHFFC